MNTNNQNNYNFIKPIGVVSPMSGTFVQPKLETVTDRWGKTTTNAKWIDPSSGQVFKQGMVSIKEKDGTVYDINTHPQR